MSEVKGYWQNYIDGTWIDGGAGRIDVINPGTGEKLATKLLRSVQDEIRSAQAAKSTRARMICGMEELGDCRWGFSARY